jgi:hypothetical protein
MVASRLQLVLNSSSRIRHSAYACGGILGKNFRNIRMEETDYDSGRISTAITRNALRKSLVDCLYTKQSF